MLAMQDRCWECFASTAGAWICGSESLRAALFMESRLLSSAIRSILSRCGHHGPSPSGSGIACHAAHHLHTPAQEVLVLRKKIGGRQTFRDECGDPRGDSSDGEMTETEGSPAMTVDQLFHDTAGWKVSMCVNLRKYCRSLNASSTS